jgi:hypothetical protein
MQPKFEDDGIIFALAEACAKAVREVACFASAERFVHLAEHHALSADGELIRERVASRLQMTFQTLETSLIELREYEEAENA